MATINILNRYTPRTLSILLLLVINSLEVQNESLNTNQSIKLSLNPHNKLIILSYDGFRYDYTDKTETPNIDKLIEAGVYTKYIIPQFVTKTFPNHQSIATGLYTESHGIIDNILFDPKYGRVVSGYGDGDDEFWNFNDDVAPLWIWNERAGNGHISGVQFPGSDHPYGKNRTLPTHYLAYNKSRTFETRMDYVIKWLTDPEKPANLVLMYFDEPDGEGHNYGPNSLEVKKAIEKLDQITGYLIDKLNKSKILDQVNIILLSDHGFEESSLRKMINITAAIDPGLYTVYGKSPVLQILPKTDKFTEVYEAFKLMSNGQKFSVYKKEELPEEWHYGKNRRIMPIVLVADPGYVFDENLLNYKKKHNLTDDPDLDKVFGVHGYDNKYLNMHPFFQASGPAFKRGFEIKPFENVDLFPLMCTIIGIPMPPNNGSIKNVENLLVDGFVSDAITILLVREYILVIICSSISLFWSSY